RVPLQYLTGWAALGGITVSVGPGVFIPRPETELLLEWGIGLLKGRDQPVVVDLCSGSGALALAVAHAKPDSVVYAVGVDPNALSRQITTATTAIHITWRQAAHAKVDTDQERKSFMQRYHPVRSSFAAKTTYNPPHPPLPVKRPHPAESG